MEHIQDVYAKKPEMIDKIFDHLTKVNLKVDGKPFQVVYNDETGELEYHGRSGNETKVGPMIDDMYRLFSKPINDAIRHIEKRTEVFKKYKFLTFEVISEILLLTAIITKDGKFIDDPDEIDDIAKELETDVMPCLWKGKISEEQKNTLIEAISTNIIPTKDEFVKWVKALFGTYDKFPKTLISRSEEFIEGIVFFYNVDGKVVEYKLVDPTFRQSVKDNQSNMKADNEENGEKYKQIYEIFVDWAKDNAAKLDDDRMRSIEFNFIEMMKDVKRYNKLMNLGAGLTTITTDAYFLQPDRISDELKKAIKKHGKVYQLLYEKFVRLFWKAKKRNFTISKEFQQEVNNITELFENIYDEIYGEYFFESKEGASSFKYAPESKEESIKYFKEHINKGLSDDEINSLFNLVYKYSEELTDTPFRYSTTSVKLARVYLTSEEFRNELSKLLGNQTIEFNAQSFKIANLIIHFGNGSVGKVSTASQETGTCDVWNKYIVDMDENPHQIALKLDNIVDTLTYIDGDNEKQFSKEWRNSFYNQILQILLVCKELNINPSEYTLERRGQDNLSKTYEKLDKIFTDVISNKEGMIDNYDPSDAILYKTDKREEIITELNNIISICKTPENCIVAKNEYLNKLFQTNLCLGISLKKISGKRGKAGKFEKMNFGDNQLKTKVISAEISKKTSDKQVKVECRGTFNLSGFTNPDTGKPMDNAKDFIMLTLRSFNSKGDKNTVAMDVQLNDKEPSLGKVPKRDWVKTIFTNENTKSDITFNLSKCVEKFKEWINKTTEEEKNDKFTEFIEDAMKTSSSCFPYILIH